MADLIGFSAIAFISLVTVLIALRFPNISNFLYVALIVRILTIFFGHYIFILPDSTADMESFEREAWEISERGFFNLLDYYPGPGPDFISWVIAIPYSLFGRSVLMAQSISLLFSIGSIFLIWKITYKTFGLQTANKVGWIVALYPSIILYSVLVLREIYFCFFILLAIYGVLNWVKYQDFKSIIFAMLGFIATNFFHGVGVIGGVVFLTIVGLNSFKKLIFSIFSTHINLKNLIISSIIIFILGLFLSNNIEIQYLGSFTELFDVDRLLTKSKDNVYGPAAYPEWTKIASISELFYKVPSRIVFFLFSPFPWDVESQKHLVGLVDSLLTMYLVFLIFNNIKVIWKDPFLKIILIMLVTLLIAFSIGVGNFGTSIRHKVKIIFLIILLAAPLFPSFVFSKKFNIYKKIKK